MSTRAHPISFTVAETDDGAEIEGDISFTLCKLGPGRPRNRTPVPDEEKPRFDVTFTGDVERFGPETAHWSGTFEIVGGTGRYEELTGSGTISAYLLCFNPAGCAAEGQGYRDAQFILAGRYSTPELDSD